MRRRLELDAARGLMLVWMTATHLPTILSVYSNQFFGFVSASEGFIFLSALFTGRIYYRLAARDGHPAMHRKLLSRTLRLYGYHALLLAFAFLVAVPIAARSNRPNLYNLLDFYFAVGPLHAITQAALLIYRPPLLDILPMYIIFLLFTPFALTVSVRHGWRHILSASFTIWVLAQLGLGQVIYEISRHLGVRIPFNEMGSFDLWAWQLCWVLGLWCGVRWAEGDWSAESWARRLTIPAALIAITLLIARYTIVDFGPVASMFDKWHLGPVRVINFACVTILLIRFQSYLKPFAVRPLILLGQSSLQVFCVHLLFCFAGLTLLGTESMLGAWKQSLLIVATYSALLLTAKIFAKTETQQGKTAPLPPRAAKILPAINSALDPSVSALDQPVVQTSSSSSPQTVGALVETERYPQSALEPTAVIRKDPHVAN